MKIYRDLNSLPVFKNAVITTGTFDGVHCGHLKIIDQLKEEAAKMNGESVLVTFHPHPRIVLQKQNVVKLLTTYEEKMEILSHYGIDHVVVVPFTEQFSAIPAEDYIREFLVKKLQVSCIISGYDHHFGKDRKGDFKMLEKFGKELNFQVKEIPEYVLKEVTVSSTRIRKALQDGEVEIANQNLGYDYFLNGQVVHGNKIGRTIGYPTANIHLEDGNKLIPAYGVYAIYATRINSESDTQKYPGMLSIGIRPTLADNREVIEANLFDFNQNLYGRPIQIRFKKYFRPEIKFENLELLTEKIREDERIIRRWWSVNS